MMKGPYEPMKKEKKNLW